MVEKLQVQGNKIFLESLKNKKSKSLYLAEIIGIGDWKTL